MGTGNVSMIMCDFDLNQLCNDFNVVHAFKSVSMYYGK